eukprot:7772924-Karenia_brevis.AAC.1
MQSPDGKLQIHAKVLAPHGSEDVDQIVTLLIGPNKPLAALMPVCYTKVSLHEDDVKVVFAGQPIHAEDTATTIGIVSGQT